METPLNSFFSNEEQIDFLKNNHLNHLPNEKIKQYQYVIKENKEYPNIHSKKQFETIIKSNNKTNYLIRLLEIIQYVLQKKDVLYLVNDFNEVKGDDVFYYNLLSKFNENRKFLKSPKRFITQPEFIYYKILTSFLKKNNKKIESLMDIGCGNGKKAEDLGKLFSIKPENIICADIEKWFNYNNSKRKKRNLELLAIDEMGEIKYKENSIDLITIIHAIHHWCYPETQDYITRMKSLRSIIKKDGLVAIIEHDVLTTEDACLVDIEHGLFECVLYRNQTGFYKDYNSKYLNFIELEMIMKKAGFELILFNYYDGGFINKKTIPDKSYLALFRPI